jgi:cobalamin transport system substrate-binding protein
MMMFKQGRGALFAALAVLSLGALVTSCSSNASGAPPTGSQATYPKTIRAANGVVRIAARPTAIVSLSPTATEMLYAMGAGTQVKAVDKFSDYPAGTPMTSLDGNSPNVEAIASYHPDLVVVSQEATGLDQQLKALGIPVVYDPPATDLNQEYQQFVQLGDATSHASQASAEVTRIKAQIAAIVRSTPKPASPETYYYELEQTYYSETSSTFIGQVLGLLGLKSIADSAQGAAASGGYPQLNGEFILKANPDYILLADTICCGQSAATVAARPGWSTLAAVKDGRVLGLNDDIASRWGPRIVVLLQDVATEITQHRVSPTS